MITIVLADDHALVRQGLKQILLAQPDLAVGGEAANHGEPARFVEAARAQMEGRTLRRHATALAIQGRTTIEEAMRASTQIDD